jgi:hypothetical protein
VNNQESVYRLHERWIRNLVGNLNYSNGLYVDFCSLLAMKLSIRMVISPFEGFQITPVADLVHIVEGRGPRRVLRGPASLTAKDLAILTSMLCCGHHTLRWPPAIGLEYHRESTRISCLRPDPTITM